MTTAITIGMIIIYVAIMMGIGVYTSKQAKSVNDFVLGGRNVGSWLTAFAYGTSYFSAVVFIGYAGQFGWSYGVSAAWVGVGNALLGRFGKTHPYHDAVPGRKDNAGVL